MYKKATKIGLKFPTSVGELTVDQVWTLNQSQLANAIKSIKKVLKKDEDDDLLFLTETKTVDTLNQLRFDLLKDIYLTKKQEAEDIRTAASNKEHNEKIYALIQEKQQGKMQEMSIDELTALIRE